MNTTEQGRDEAKFWGRLDLPNGRTGYTPLELVADEQDKLTLYCRRPTQAQFFGLLPSKPLPEGTVVSMAYQSEDLFELWSAEITLYLGEHEGMDGYEVREINLEMEQSGRREERCLVKVPLILRMDSKVINREYRFNACELSRKGVGLWFPRNLRDKLRQDAKYELTFAPPEVEAFAFSLSCVREPADDSFSKGFTLGFEFIEPLESSIAERRLNQLLEARGQVIAPQLERMGHYLSPYWVGEFFGELH